MQVSSAVILGLLASIPLASILLSVESLNPAPRAAPLYRAGGAPDAHNIAHKPPLRIGVFYEPPAKPPDGRIYVEDGFELDLAEAIGQRLAVPIQIARVEQRRSGELLRSHSVDVVIARMPDGEQLPGDVTVIPTGYESGLSPVARSDKALRAWSDLAGSVVCIPEANERGRLLIERLGATARTVRAPAQALMLVRTGECAATIHDRAVLDPLFKKMSWQKFSATLPPVEPARLVVAVTRQDRDLASAIAGALAAEQASGQWQKRQERWASLVAFEVYRDQVAADCH